MEKEPEFLQRAYEACRHHALRMIANAREIDGMLAWVDPKPQKGFKVDANMDLVNMAIDYGQTGVVYVLSETGKYLKDQEILEAAKKGADFIVKHAVKTERGYKFPWHVYLEKQ